MGGDEELYSALERSLRGGRRTPNPTVNDSIYLSPSLGVSALHVQRWARLRFRDVFSLVLCMTVCMVHGCAEPCGIGGIFDHRYGSGRMLTSEVKNILSEVLKKIVASHTEARAKVNMEVIEQFMAVRKLDF